MQPGAFLSRSECVPTPTSTLYQLCSIPSVRKQLHCPRFQVAVLPLVSHGPLALSRFDVEDLTDTRTVEQSGAESDTGFAKALQAAVQAGATCIGRTRAPEAALG